MSSPVIDVLLPAALAFILFSLGLTLRIDDFRRVVQRPKAVLAGLIGQMLVVPLTGFVVAWALRLPPEMAVGLVILAACPGGVSSGLLTHLARGETALSISLTAISSLAAIVSLPLVVDVALRLFMGTGVSTPLELPVWRLVRGVFFLTTVPVLAGMALRRWREALALRLQKPFEKVSTLFFVLIVLATFMNQRQALLDNFAAVGPATVLLNAVVMAFGIGVAAWLGLGRAAGVAIAMECGLQNAALGIYVAASVLATPLLAVPSVVYAVVMNIGALLGVALWRRHQGGGKTTCCEAG